MTAAERQTSPLMVGVAGGGGVHKRKLVRNWKTLLRLSESPIPSRAISLIRDKVSALEYAVVPKKGLENEDYSEDIAVVRQVLDNPNAEDDDWSTFVGQIIEDQIVFDAGAFEYVEKPKFVDGNEILALESVPGFTLERVANWDGNPKSPKWVQKIEGLKEVPLLGNQVEILTRRKRSSQVYGFSSLETAVGLMDSWLRISSYQATVASEAYPAFMFSLGEESTEDQTQAFRMYWDQELTGVGRPGIIGGTKDPKSIQLKSVDDDGLYPKYYEVLVRTLAFTFGLKPQDFGIDRDVNRNQGEISQSATTDEAVKPYALLLARRITNRVIPRIADVAKRERIRDLVYFYPHIDPFDEKQQAEIIDLIVKDDLISLDEGRVKLGYGAREDGRGILTLSEFRAELGVNPQNPGTDPENGRAIEGQRSQPPQPISIHVEPPDVNVTVQPSPPPDVNVTVQQQARAIRKKVTRGKNHEILEVIEERID